ncbi:MAG: hypothetical protein LAO51_16455 [Acidobacteriia bacterium]|nr:hypothetical protein [Terriglobia bacterium]
MNHFIDFSRVRSPRVPGVHRSATDSPQHTCAPRHDVIGLRVGIYVGLVALAYSMSAAADHASDCSSAALSEVKAVVTIWSSIPARGGFKGHEPIVMASCTLKKSDQDAETVVKNLAQQMWDMSDDKSDSSTTCQAMWGRRYPVAYWASKSRTFVFSGYMCYSGRTYDPDRPGFSERDIAVMYNALTGEQILLQVTFQQPRL